MKPYIYIRTLKHAEHTVFCVQEGQKAYFDPLFNRMVPYSSGQQIKRCILTTLTDDLNVPMAPITFNYNITKKEYVLDGATVMYGSASELRAMLEYDFSQEREFSYYRFKK